MYEWISYQYRFLNPEAVEKFGVWVAQKDWVDVAMAEGSNNKATAYRAAGTGAMEEFFPLITVRRKSTDFPWINRRIRKLICRRKGVYVREGCSSKWKRLKKVTEELIKKRREKYLDSQRECLLVEDASRNFFRNVKAFQAKERPKAFNSMDLFPGKEEAEVAAELAAYFNWISAEFSPLEPSDIPRTRSRKLPVLRPYQVGQDPCF